MALQITRASRPLGRIITTSMRSRSLHLSPICKRILEPPTPRTYPFAQNTTIAQSSSVKELHSETAAEVNRPKVFIPLTTAINRAMAAEGAVKTFMGKGEFAVVGASSDPNKFGHKIFRWYTTHSLPVTPINPSSATITALPASGSTPTEYKTLPSLSALPNPKDTAVSIITPPHVTKKVLEEAKKVGVEAVWLQPGTYNDEVLEFAKKEFVAGVGGRGGGGGEGWCVLVDGEAGLAEGRRGRL